jgi:hypothetical protein
MYTTHLKHSREIQVFRKFDTSSWIEYKNIWEISWQAREFLDRQMDTPDIQARVQWIFEALFTNIQLDTRYLDKINNPFQLAQLSLSSTNEWFATQAREKFLDITWGDQNYLDTLGNIRESYIHEKQALLATNQFANQTHTILNSQA